MPDLFDSLFDINRPALNAYVTQGQAMAGLRTAQTQEALANAQHAVDENNANGQLSDQLTSLFAAQGDPLASQKGAVAAGMMISGHGNAVQALQALSDARKSGLLDIVSNPSTPDPQRIAALQALSGHGDVGQSQNFGNQIVNATQPGAAPTVTQTPLSESEEWKNTHPTAGFGAQNIPQDAQQVIADGIRNNPSLAANVRSLTSYGGWRVAYAMFTGHPYPDNGPQFETPQPGAQPGQSGAQSGAQPAPPNQIPSGAPGTTGQPPLQTGVTPAPGVSFQEQSHIRNYYAGGQGMSRVVALGTMAEHAQLWSQIAAQLGNGNFTPTNSINVLWQKLFGQDAPSDLRTVGDFLGREAVRATVNSGAGTGQERELQLGTNSSPQQFEGGAATLMRLAMGQYRNLDSAARRGGVDISQILDPSVRGIFTHGLPATGTLPAMAGSGAPSATPGGAPNSLEALMQAANAELAKRNAGAPQ